MARPTGWRSASTMRPRAAATFSLAIWMFETTFSNRLCSAPRLAREVLICAKALSTCTSAVCAPPKPLTSSPEMPVVATAAVEPLAKPATVALLVVPVIAIAALLLRRLI